MVWIPAAFWNGNIYLIEIDFLLFFILLIFAICIYRLIQKNYDVVAYMADVGQNEDFKKAKQKAKAIGAKEVSSQ